MRLIRQGGWWWHLAVDRATTTAIPTHKWTVIVVAYGETRTRNQITIKGKEKTHKKEKTQDVIIIINRDKHFSFFFSLSFALWVGNFEMKSNENVFGSGNGGGDCVGPQHVAWTLSNANSQS